MRRQLSEQIDRRTLRGGVGLRSLLSAVTVLSCLAALQVMAAPLEGAQDGDQLDKPAPPTKIEGPLCPHCKTTGKLPNPFYEKVHDLEENVLYCSYCIEKDKNGLGLPWLVCKRCRNKALKAKAQVEFDAKAAELKAWLAERRKIDAKLDVDEPLLHLQTKHFVWAWSVPGFKAKDKKYYKPHEGLHLYADRMEKFHSDFQRVHKITDADNIHNLHQLFFLERQRHGTVACREYAFMPTPNGRASRQGTPSVYVTWYDRNKRPTDEDFYMELLHNVNHLFTAVYKNSWWLHECGIAYEGGSHWWEIYYTKRAGTRCFVESDSESGWVSKKWQAVVKKAVLAGQHPSLAEILTIPGTSLKTGLHPFAWSYIDFMMHKDPAKVMQFYYVIKLKKHPREAFRNAFNYSIPAFQAEWEAWVIETYSIQEDSPAIPKRLRFR